ncbi:type II toxin-antitoxin system VapC family toxin [Candidimonas nitroreducens]|uniref:Ribonuclease VapC n=1 Tax=Candidimonas nitroreducens TaxID=683354 RepID=A0A225M679_9BURK|nr:type II toxin-antitoxin system VapC family toxin [Candidimonas nitroreducens]OWT56192.1 VapC toxin family PIN domain ribonuclease [Candidimonas nitroreducens]
MLVIDTNVISELWKAQPAPQVVAWMGAQMIETLYLSAITVAELRFGLAAMPQGKRRATYLELLERKVIPAFAGRVLPFGLDASRAYAELMAAARVAGNAIGKADGYIAASAATRAYTVATRDISPVEATGLAIINP